MTSRWSFSLLGVFVIAFWAVTASAQHPETLAGYGGSSWLGGFRMSLPTLVRGVGLTEAQQSQVKQIVASHQPQFQALVGQLRTAHEQLAAKLYTPGPVKAEELAPLLEQIGQLRSRLAQEGVQVALEVRGVLTPEQLAKAGQIRQRLNELRAEAKSLLGEGR